MQSDIALTRPTHFFSIPIYYPFPFQYGSKNNGALRDTVEYIGILQYQKRN
jgi:hypothetical protein